MYELVREKTREAGEVMIRMDSGAEHELHKHNAEFHDDTRIVKVDADDKTHWVDPDNIERAWIHEDF